MTTELPICPALPTARPLKLEKPPVFVHVWLNLILADIEGQSTAWMRATEASLNRQKTGGGPAGL